MSGSLGRKPSNIIQCNASRLTGLRTGPRTGKQRPDVLHSAAETRLLLCIAEFVFEARAGWEGLSGQSEQRQQFHEPDTTCCCFAGPIPTPTQFTNRF